MDVLYSKSLDFSFFPEWKPSNYITHGTVDAKCFVFALLINWSVHFY